MQTDLCLQEILFFSITSELLKFVYFLVLFLSFYILNIIETMPGRNEIMFRKNSRALFKGCFKHTMYSVLQAYDFSPRGLTITSKCTTHYDKWQQTNPVIVVFIGQVLQSLLHDPTPSFTKTIRFRMLWCYVGFENPKCNVQLLKQFDFKISAHLTM